MAIDPFLLALLEDPTDHGSLRYVAAKNVLYNPRRRVAYEVRDDIAVLLPDATRPVDDVEHASLMNDPDGVDTKPSSAR